MSAITALTQSQAAELAEVTVNGLQAIGRSADPPPKGAGGYPPREYGQWLKRRHLRGVGVSSDGVVYDYETERARLTKAQADKTELEARELRGEMVMAEHVIESWSRMLGAVRARLLSLPSKVGPRARAAAGDEEAARVIEAEVLEALEELSGDGLPERTRARRAGMQGGATTAAAADGEPVGGRVPAAQSRKRRRAGAVAD